MTNYKRWQRGLWTAVIVGLAGSFDSSLALIIIVPEKFNLSAAIGRTLFTALVLGVLTGVRTLFVYLSQHPLPPENGGDYPNGPDNGP